MRYTTRLAVFVLFFVLSLCGITHSKFDVHVVYFKPTDAPDIDKARHDKLLKDIQKYLQSEMTRHGFTDKTFPLELDAQGKVVIHVVNGKHNTAHYDWGDEFAQVEPELPFAFNNELNPESRDNIQLVIMGGISLNGDWNGGPDWGFTWHGGRWGGVAFVTMDRINDFPNHYLGVVAHELGHAFGLDPAHNNVRESFNGRVIAWGRTTAEWGDRMRLLDFEAALIDSRPIFREMEIQEDIQQPNKNEDLAQGTDKDVDKDKGDPISVNVQITLTTSWARLKSR